MNEQAPTPEMYQKSLHKDRYVVIRKFLPDAVTQIAHQYTMMKILNSEFTLTDTQVPNTPALYGDTLMDTLLENAVPAVEIITGDLLYPTCSYMRVYKRGDQLAPHIDRLSCEVSMTLCLGYNSEGAGSPDYCWPIWADNSMDYSADKDKASQPASLGEGKGIFLKPGDGVIYYGTEVRHWRDPYPGNHHAQVFFHFVRQNGPYANHKYDFRPMLGASHTTRQVPDNTR